MPKRRKPSRSRKPVRIGRVSLVWNAATSKTSPRGGWYCRWTDDARQRCSQRAGPDLSKARAIAAEINTAVCAGIIGARPTDRRGRPLEGLLTEYERKLERGSFQKHVADVMRRLSRCFYIIDAACAVEVSPEKLERFLDRRAKAGRSAGTVKQDRRAIKSFFKWAYDTDRIEKDPAKGLQVRTGPAVRKRQAHTVDEVARILNAARAGEPWEYAAYMLGFGAGLRQGEIRALRWGDVDLGDPEAEAAAGTPSAGLYRLTETQQKKKQNTVTPMLPELTHYLRIYKLETEALRGRAISPEEPVVDGLPGDPMELSRARKRTLLRAGIGFKNFDDEVADWHSMRHTFQTVLGSRGDIDMKTKSMLMRHADIKTTAGYDHSTVIRQREALERMPAFLMPG